MVDKMGAVLVVGGGISGFQTSNDHTDDINRCLVR